MDHTRTARIYTADYAEAYTRYIALLAAGFDVLKITYLGDGVEYLGSATGQEGFFPKLGKVSFLEGEIAMGKGHFEIAGRKYLPATDGLTEPAWDFHLGAGEMFFS